MHTTTITATQGGRAVHAVFSLCSKSCYSLAALLLAPCLALAADPSAPLSVQVAPAPGGGGVQVVQSKMTVLYPQYPDLTYTYTLNLPQTITPGDSVFGGALFEWNKGNGTTGGNLDTVMVGSERATIDDTNGWCCGPALVTFHLLNVQKPESTITVSSSTGGNFINESISFAEISGLPSTAAIDAHTSQFMHLPAAPAPLTSGSITPSVPGDFLYGIGFIYDFGETPFTAGPGWSLINNCSTQVAAPCVNAEFDPMHEYQVYNSVNPVVASFLPPSGYGGNNESWAGIIAVKME